MGVVIAVVWCLCHLSSLTASKDIIYIMCNDLFLYLLFLCWGPHEAHPVLTEISIGANEFLAV